MISTSSGGSNLGPTSKKLRDSIAQNVADYRSQNGLATNAPVPADAVTASGSGLDPHISVANAELQAARVAKARGLSVEQVRDLVAQNTHLADLGFLGEPGVNVLELNLALNRAQAASRTLVSKRPPQQAVEPARCPLSLMRETAFHETGTNTVAD